MKKAVTILGMIAILIWVVIIGYFTVHTSKENSQENIEGDINEKDKISDTEEVARNIFTQTFGNRLYNNSVAPTTINEIFKINSSSSRFDIFKAIVAYSSLVPIPRSVFVVVDRFNLTGFYIKNITVFNKVVSTIDHINEKDNFLNITISSLIILPHWNVNSEVMWSLPSDDSSFIDWFENNETYDFHPPIINTSISGYYVECFAWERNAGILRFHSFDINQQGEIINHTSIYLGERLGDYILI